MQARTPLVLVACSYERYNRRKPSPVVTSNPVAGRVMVSARTRLGVGCELQPARNGAQVTQGNGSDFKKKPLSPRYNCAER
jgi:hypothetical protein